MTPEMWLDLGPSHTVLDTAFPQIANSLGDSARCCLATALAFTFYPGKCMPSPLWSWYHGWVGRGAKIFQVSASSKGAAYAASGAQGITPEPLGVVPHARGVAEILFSAASGLVSTTLRSRSGAAFCCWLGRCLVRIGSAASGPVSTILRSRSGAAFCSWLGRCLVRIGR